MNWSDQLYRLLPAVHQIRDGQQREPLRAFLQIIGEQTQQIQDDIERLYDNWFIETSDDWVVPYLGDLVGFRRTGAAGEPADAITQRGQLLNRFLYPRREIANVVRRRRRKGTLSVLEDMAKDVSGWPARAVEFSQLVTFFQNVKHPQSKMGRTFSLRDFESHPRVNTPFDTVAHTVDVRAIQTQPGVGWYQPKQVGLFVWRRCVLPMSMIRPHRACRKIKNSEVRYYTFSRLGIERPIYIRSAMETDEFHIADELNLPVPLYRHLLADEHGHPKDDYYGLGGAVPKSFAIYLNRGGDPTAVQSTAEWSLVPAEQIQIADLDDATLAALYQPSCCDQITVDPERGILLFGCKFSPRDIRVSYHYASTMELGGGEYNRQVVDKPTTPVVRVRDDSNSANGTAPHLFNAVIAEMNNLKGSNSKCQPSPNVALLRTIDPDPAAAVKWSVKEDLCIEITESDTFRIPADESLVIEPGKTLIIRAGRGVWPMLHLQPTGHDFCASPWQVSMGEGSQLILDGLLICGVTVQLNEGPKENRTVPVTSGCRPCDDSHASERRSTSVPELHLRHTTFVPGGRADPCLRCQHASLCLNVSEGLVSIRHSIVGTMNVEHSKCSSCGSHRSATRSAAVAEKPRCPVNPISIEVTDSIIDAAYGLPAIYSNCGSPAHAELTVERSTILGDLCVQQMARAEDSLFAGIVHVQRRGLGYMRFCYVPNSDEERPHLPGTAHLRRALSIVNAVQNTMSTLLRLGTHDLSGADWCYATRTPPQFKCVPGLKPSNTSQVCTTGCGDSPAAASMAERKPIPVFVSTEYGHPGYCELSQDCSQRILQGSEDQSEFGVLHDLYRPQRGAALQSRLQEYTPADMQSSVIYADDLHPSEFRGPH